MRKEKKLQSNSKRTGESHKFSEGAPFVPSSYLHREMFVIHRDSYDVMVNG